MVGIYCGSIISNVSIVMRRKNGLLIKMKMQLV